MITLRLPQTLDLVRILIVVVLVASVFFLPYNTLAQLGFGGFATVIDYCDEGVWLFVGPPNTVGDMMWSWGSLGFAWTYEPIGAQWMLGTWGGFETCTEGIYTIGGGMLILMSGFSV